MDTWQKGIKVGNRIKVDLLTLEKSAWITQMGPNVITRILERKGERTRTE